jgi:KDO2-lipid IV(A) lauroyltransferase
MKLQNIAINPRTMQLGMWFSQHTPEWVGHRLAWWASGIMCQVKPLAYRIVQTNLSQVLGPSADWQTLEQSVRQVFHTTLRTNFDLFRSLRMQAEELAALVDFPEEARALVRSVWNRAGGSILVFPHLSSFDLAGQVMGRYLPDAQVLTLPDPPPGFQLANRLRERSGVDVTPLSSMALREAVKRLRRGGLVSLAGDRPVSKSDEPVSFFGRPARVPSGHVRLALKTGAVILVAYCFMSQDTGRYTVHIEPPLEMVRTGDREEDVQVNMRQVLDVLESVIRRWAGQWQMYVPVWPELLEA